MTIRRCAFTDLNGVVVEMSMCDDDPKNGMTPDQWCALRGFGGWFECHNNDAKMKVVETGDKVTGAKGAEAITKRFKQVDDSGAVIGETKVNGKVVVS